MKRTELHQRLESLYAAYHRPCFIDQDPLVKVRLYPELADREIVGLLAAGLAYGRVASILNSIDNLLARMGPSPSSFVHELTPRRARAALAGFKHRWTTGDEIARLLLAVRDLQHSGISLEDALVMERKSDDPTILPALGPWVRRLNQGRRNSLLVDPAGGSACKRMCLFLRWMVREDAIDPGGWTRIPPSLLVVPVDVHMLRMAKRLRLTRRNQGDLTTAVEITAAFRRCSPDDPTRYDFALTRPGILGELPPP
jgi:uncharacterized protein (TIGR02757 family)